MKPKRERLEELLKQIDVLANMADAREGGRTPEDVEAIVKTSEEIATITESIALDNKVTNAVAAARNTLSVLSGEAGSVPDNETLAERSGIVDPKGMTLGEAFAASPAYADFIKSFGGTDGAIRDVRGVKSLSYATGNLRHQRKTLITGGSDTSAGAFTVAQRLPIIADIAPGRTLYVRDLCTNLSITSDSFDYVQVTSRTNNAAAVVEATSSADDTTYGTPLSNNVQGRKPESAIAFAVVSAPVEIIAHFIPITRRAAADAPQMRALVDQFLLYGLAEEEEDQILNGNGTSPNLRGILQTVGINTVGSAGTDLDAVVDAIAAIRADGNNPTAMVIHPNDWFSTGFLMAKESTGGYLVGNPGASIDAVQSLWGLRVVVTPAMTADTALVGDFSKAVVADREQASILVSDSHKDWFTRNLLAVLAEERLAFGVLDPEAFCTITAV